MKKILIVAAILLVVVKVAIFSIDVYKESKMIELNGPDLVENKFQAPKEPEIPCIRDGEFCEEDQPWEIFQPNN